MVSAGRLCRPSAGITAAAIQVKKSKLEVVTRKTGELSSVGFRAARVASAARTGDGKTFPKSGDRIKMYYTGYFTATGKMFDSTLNRE